MRENIQSSVSTLQRAMPAPRKVSAAPVGADACLVKKEKKSTCSKRQNIMQPHIQPSSLVCFLFFHYLVGPTSRA